jgi:rod shape-determining protein MreC
MESFFSRYKNGLVLMLVLLAQVVLLAMQVRRPAPGMPDGHNVRLWRYLVSSVVTPPARLVHYVGLNIRAVWTNYIDLRHLREDNQKLADENDRLRLEQASLAQDAREAQRLRDVLDFRGRYIDTTQTAQVIGTSGTDQARVIIIDRGSKDGLDAQMPVITPDGVVGKIKNVFPHTAQVLLLSDQTSGTGVVLQDTRIRGVMKGNASGQPQIVNISPDERIKAGELVVTSGGDQVYPPGLPVGVVDHVVADPDTPYVNVVVKPNADLAQLEEVLIVTRLSDKMPFGQEKDMMQSEVDALAQKQRASDVLSEKLPSLRDPNAPATSTTASTGAEEDAASASSGDPARPVRPPQPLRPDRYSPGTAQPAESLVPGQAPPGLHRETSTQASSQTPERTTKPAVGASTAASTSQGFIPSRFPARVVANSTPSGNGASSGVTGSGAAGLTLPTQPMVPKSASQTATPTGASTPTSVAKTAGVSTTPRTTAVGSGTGTASNSSATPTATRPLSTTTASGTSQASETGATPRRRIVVSAESGGILTPAGMGLIGGTPRPKPANPATNTTTGTPGANPSQTATPKPAGTTTTPDKKPQSPPPAQQTPPGGR